MILYGVKTEYYGKKVMEDKKCANTKCENTTFLVTNAYIAPHIFFIPFMPVSHKPLVICPSCKRRFSLKRFSKINDLDLTKDDINDIKAELHSQLPPETAKKHKRRSTVGTIFACLLFGVIVIGMIAAIAG